MINVNEEQLLEGEINLIDIWMVIRKRFVLILTILFIFIFGAFLSLQRKVMLYTSTGVLLIEKPSNYGDNGMPDYYSSLGYVQTYAEMLKGESNLKETAEKIKHCPRITIEALQSISVQAVKDTLLLRVSYSHSNASVAKNVVDTVSEVFVNKMSETNKANLQIFTKELETQIIEFTTQINLIEQELTKKSLAPSEKESKQNEQRRLLYLKGTLQEQLLRQNLITQQFLSSVKISEKGTLPTHPSNSKDSLTISIAVVLGLFIGLLLAFLLEYLDDTIKTEDDLRKIADIPVFVVIPRFETHSEDSFDYPNSQREYDKKPV